jgi:predicted N-formylglutamate amidohydrolase
MLAAIRGQSMLRRMPKARRIPSKSPAHIDMLLHPDDPQPFELVNPQGKAPLVLFCDHAGRAVPQRLDSLGLAPGAFDRHIAWDIGIADLGRQLSALMDAPLLVANYSRLVIDCNRHIDDPTSIAQVSDGIDIPANRNLSTEARQQRVTEIFRPYHDALTQLIEGKLAQDRAPVILSLHSFTAVMNGYQRPWQIGILWNEDARLPVPLMRRFAAEPGVTVGDNEPYSGRDGHGYSMQVHAEALGLAHALIEVRQDLIADKAGAATWAQTLYRVCSDVLRDPALYHRLV